MMSSLNLSLLLNTEPQSANLLNSSILRADSNKLPLRSQNSFTHEQATLVSLRKKDFVFTFFFFSPKKFSSCPFHTLKLDSPGWLAKWLGLLNLFSIFSEILQQKNPKKKELGVEFTNCLTNFLRIFVLSCHKSKSVTDVSWLEEL